MSQKFKKTVEYFSKLQGVGPRQAARIALAVLNWPKSEIKNFAQIISELSDGVNLCQNCFNFSETELCHICSNPRRDLAKICVVDKVTSLNSIERSGLFLGHYHILGGVINPVEGSLPSNLKINELVERVKKLQTQFSNGQSKELEIILATDPDTYGETTAMYIQELIRPLGVKTTRLAKGLSSSSHLEYADAITLQNAFKNRR